MSRTFRDPDEYQGKPVCIRCGSGWPACPEVARVLVLSQNEAHRISCERYQWADELCDTCEKSYEDEPPA